MDLSTRAGSAEVAEQPLFGVRQPKLSGEGRLSSTRRTDEGELSMLGEMPHGLRHLLSPTDEARAHRLRDGRREDQSIAAAVGADQADGVRGVCLDLATQSRHGLVDGARLHPRGIPPHFDQQFLATHQPARSNRQVAEQSRLQRGEARIAGRAAEVPTLQVDRAVREVQGHRLGPR
jgi:hypothetical protein